ncbi:MAG: flagellar basal body P-ring formation chaperone FlgA [Candidatus Krumholzibacteriia bacterium]
MTRLGPWLGLLVVLAVGRPVPADAWTLVLADSVRVAPGNVAVSDLAASPVPVDAGQVVVIPGLRPGLRCQVNARTVLRRLVLAGLAADIALGGADACLVEVVGEAVASDELVARIRALIAPQVPSDQPDAPPGWVEVAVADPDFVTHGDWEVAWPEPRPLCAGRNLITVQLEGDHGRQRLSVAVTVHTYARTPQATAALARGEDLDDRAVGWVWTDLARGGRDALVDQDALAGMMLTRDVAAGEAVTGRDLAVRPLVRRGEQVDLVVQRGRVSAVIRAECRQDGHRGELVSVLNPLTKRPVLASVAGPGVVTLGR